MLDLNNFNKYSKAPHDPEKILPEEYALYFLHVYIYMLEQYCKTNNIIFIWNVWEHEYCDVYEKTKKYETSVFNNYLHINSHFDNLFAMDCHSEYKTHKLFDYAADSQHWGIHKHIHLFEEIYKNLQEKIKK